jgi:hypothetical protein
MGKCVIVLGPPRSGTSAIAGMLHQMGVHMGDNLMPANRYNPLGFFEDLDFVIFQSKLCQSTVEPMIDPAVSPQERIDYRNLLKEKMKREIWGFKDPRTCMLLPVVCDLLLELGEGLQIIATIRPFHHMAESLAKMHGGIPLQRAAELIGRYAYARSKSIDGFLRNTPGGHDKILHMPFEQIVNDPKFAAGAIAQFVGVSPPAAASTSAAP